MRWLARALPLKVEVPLIGSFKTDENKSFWQRAGQIASRFTREGGQNILGNTFAHLRNLGGTIDNVDYWHGATLVNNSRAGNLRWGVTLGSFINSQNVRASPNDGLFMHEFGQTLQSSRLGFMYLGNVGIPSLVGSLFQGVAGHDHDNEWYEANANILAIDYLKKYDNSALLGSGWYDPGRPIQYQRD